jgi:hypothetical protein
MIYIRTIYPDGRVSLNEYAFSQFVALKKLVPENQKEAFENLQSVLLPDGRNIKEVDFSIFNLHHNA